MHGDAVDQNDTGGHTEARPAAPGQRVRLGRGRGRRIPRQPPEQETFSHARYQDTAQRQNHPETARGKDVTRERHQEPGQEEEEDAGEEGGQEGRQDALRNLVDVHHNVDSVQYPGAAEAGDGVREPHTHQTVGLFLLPMLHKLDHKSDVLRPVQRELQAHVSAHPPV